MTEFVSGEEILAIAIPGDLLEFDRGPYSHYALYLGNGKVMNLEAADFFDDSAFVSERKLEDVLRLSKVRVQNHDDLVTVKKLQPVSKIIESAKQYENKTVPYGFLTLNCEYYCTLWRHGEGFSTQSEAIKEIMHSDDWEEKLKLLLDGCSSEMFNSY